MPLYKYFPTSRIEFLSTQMVRYTQPSEFSDLFELAPYVMDVGDPGRSKNLDSFDAMFVKEAVSWEDLSQEQYGGISYENFPEYLEAHPELLVSDPENERVAQGRTGGRTKLSI